MEQMIKGVDVSWWQGLIDWQICREAGALFAFIRAGSCNSVTGENYEDFLFRENAEDAPKLMPVGYYWYFRPQHSPTSQADYFSNLVLAEDFLMPPVADIENNGGLSPAAYADSIKAFLDRVESLTGYKPIIYTSSGKWADVEPRPYWDDYDLWVAHYTSNPEPLVPEAWNLNGWIFWQYTASGDAEEFGGPGPPSGDDDIDLNWFNGTEDEFHPKMVEVDNFKNGLLFSQLDGEWSTVLPNGLRLGVIGSDKDSKDRVWYDVGGLWIPSWHVKEV
jgi:lysozyme